MFKSLVDNRFPPVARLYRRVRDQLWFNSLKVIDTPFGMRLTAEPGLAAAIPTYNEIPALQRHLAECDLFVDVGAHIGLYSCFAASLGKPVVAVEPHPLNVEVLCRNIEMNSLKTVEVYSMALSDQQGVGRLFGGQQGGSLLEGWSGIESNYATLTPINTLDNLIADRYPNRPILIKVDVEGNELNLLMGAQRTLNRSPKPIWTVEIGLTENFGGGINPHYREIFNTFWDAGYQGRPLNMPDRVLTKEDIDSWIEKRKTDHGDINYIFRE